MLKLVTLLRDVLRNEMKVVGGGATTPTIKQRNTSCWWGSQAIAPSRTGERRSKKMTLKIPSLSSWNQRDDEADTRNLNIDSVLIVMNWHSISSGRRRMRWFPKHVFFLSSLFFPANIPYGNIHSNPVKRVFNAYALFEINKLNSLKGLSFIFEKRNGINMLAQSSSYKRGILLY